MYLNKVTLIGNLTRKPELKSLPSGSYVCNFSIATNRTWKDKNGTKKEEVEFHNVIAFGKTAEVITQWMDKGSQIYIEGRLKTSTWEKDGIKHYKTEIIVENFQFGSNGQKGVKNEPKNTEQVKPQVEAKTSNVGQNQANDEGIDYPIEEINPEDIPF